MSLRHALSSTLLVAAGAFATAADLPSVKGGAKSGHSAEQNQASVAA